MQQLQYNVLFSNRVPLHAHYNPWLLSGQLEYVNILILVSGYKPYTIKKGNLHTQISKTYMLRDVVYVLK